MKTDCPACGGEVQYFADDVGGNISCRSCGAALRVDGDGVHKNDVPAAPEPEPVPIVSAPAPAAPTTPARAPAAPARARRAGALPWILMAALVIVVAPVAAGAGLVAGLVVTRWQHKSSGNTGDNSASSSTDSASQSGSTRESKHYQERLAELHDAAEKGQVSRVAELCKGTFAVDDKAQPSGKTALMIACANGNVHMTVCLLALGADANEKDSQSQTPLMHAAMNGQKHIAGILAGTVDIQPELQRLRTELGANQIDAGKVIADLGSGQVVPKVDTFRFNAANLAARDRDGLTAAMKAFLNHHYDTAAAIGGPNYEHLVPQDNKGNNLLHTMALRGDLHALQDQGDGQATSLVGYLISHVADVRNDQKQAPWMVAAAHGYLEAVKRLLENPPKPERLTMKDADGKTGLDLAAAGGYRAVVEYLAPLMGIDPSTVKIVFTDDSSGKMDPAAAPLFQAIDAADYDGLRKMLETSKLSPLVHDDQQRTLVIKAALKGDSKAVLLLTSFLGGTTGVEYLAARGADGRTALTIAAEDGKTDVVEAILLASLAGFERGQFNWCTILAQKDKSGSSALDIARTHDKKAAADFIDAFIHKHLDDRSAGFPEAFARSFDALPLNINKSGLELASTVGDLTVVEALLKWGASKAPQNVNDTNQNPPTALSIAAKNGHILVVQALLDSFAKPEEMKQYLNLPIRAIPGSADAPPAIQYAAANKHNEVVALLRRYAEK